MTDWSGALSSVAQIATAAGVLGTLVMGWWNGRKLVDLHHMVDGQQTALNTAIQIANVGQAHAEGQLQGAADEQNRVGP